MRPVPSFTLQKPSLVGVGRSGVTSESDGQDFHLHQTESSAFLSAGNVMYGLDTVIHVTTNRTLHGLALITPLVSVQSTPQQEIGS